MKDAPLHSYPWYVADWRGSETRLTLPSAAKYVYRELLDYCWIEGSIPSDELALARIAAVEIKEFRSVWPLIKAKFMEADGRLTHWRVEEKRPKLQSWANSRVKGGGAGGRTKAANLAKHEAIARRDLKVNPLPPLTPSLPTEEPLTPLLASDWDSPEDCQPDWWVSRLRELHPKPSKQRAVEDFCVDHQHRLQSPESFREFMRRVERSLISWVEFWQADNPKMAKALVTWLDEEGWTKTPPVNGAFTANGKRDEYADIPLFDYKKEAAKRAALEAERLAEGE